MHEIVEITQTKKETPKIYTLRFVLNRDTNPGQFVMVWIPGVDEIPMSVSYLGDMKGITVNNIGEATSSLCRMKPEDLIGLRGPFGNSFDFSSKNVKTILAIGGGAGMVPIAPAVESAKTEGKKIQTAIGARTKSELLFVERMKKCSSVQLSTDDGSAGYDGYVTALAAQMMEKSDFDLIITCGPEIMMKKVFELAEKNKIPVQASIERYMKCGEGICDSCSIGGHLVCKDGPIFTSDQLKGTEFGICNRDASGRRKFWKETK